MINAGCSEILSDVYEKITIRYILNSLKDDPDWAPLRSAFKMLKKLKVPEDLDELEDWMLEDECERRTKQEQKSSTRWTFPQDRRNAYKRNRRRHFDNKEVDRDEKTGGQTVEQRRVNHCSTYNNTGNRNEYAHRTNTDNGQFNRFTYRGRR